jgi:hypothetical protein
VWGLRGALIPLPALVGLAVVDNVPEAISCHIPARVHKTVKWPAGDDRAGRHPMKVWGQTRCEMRGHVSFAAKHRASRKIACV